MIELGSGNKPHSASKPQPLIPARRLKSRFPSRYAAFEAIGDKEDEPSISPARWAKSMLNNIFDNLEDEGGWTGDDDLADDHTEIERENDTESGPETSKSDRNAVYRQVRESDSKALADKKKEFTLREKRLQRETARYVYYHRGFCHANAQAISLLHTVIYQEGCDSGKNSLV